MAGESPELNDLNDDGVIERIEVTNRRNELNTCCFVLTEVTMAQKTLLALGFRRSSLEGDWTWQLPDSQNPRCPEIVFGPKNAATGAVTPRAVYQWDSKQRKYVGPEGGVDQDFIRVEGEDSPLLDEFAKTSGTPTTGDDP